MQITEKLTDLFSSKIVIDFIHQHLDEDPHKLALRYSGKVDFPIPPVLEWLDALQRARIKLPVHASALCYFTKRSFEQASSEASAHYKASQINGTSLLNLCGGIGVDDWAFSSHTKQVDSLEIDEELHELARANMYKLNIHNVERKLMDAKAFVQDSNAHYDWIYADPDRRSHDKRQVSLSDCAPDILSFWTPIQNLSDNQLIKLSPLYPIENLQKELKGLYQIEVVAVDQEVKEILAWCRTPSKESNPEVIYQATVITGDAAHSFSGTTEFGQAGRFQDETWFYEAHPALAKANLGVNYAESLGHKILIKNGLYQVSQEEINSFMGRKFRLKSLQPYNNKSFKRYLKQQAITKANFSCRMFRYTPEELKKEFKIKDGGDDYFFFFDDPLGKPHFVHALK